jgi:hypothetical protein
MSNRVASTLPCTGRGCGRARYQIEKAATKAITRPTMIDGNPVGEGVGFLVTSLDGGSGVPCLWTSGFGISIAHSARPKAAPEQFYFGSHNGGLTQRSKRDPLNHLVGASEQGHRNSRQAPLPLVDSIAAATKAAFDLATFGLRQ